MKIAITGALGIVGSAISEYLRDAGHELRPIDLAEPAEPIDGFVQADLTQYEQASKALGGVERVVHLAGINSPLRQPDVVVHNDNVRSSYNVLSAAAELGIGRVVQASSVNAIGLAWSRQPIFDYFPVDLAHQSRVEDGYSLSKLIQELQADALTRRHENLSVISLRLHAVLADAEIAQGYAKVEPLGEKWAANGLFGYCTFESVADAFLRGLTAEVSGHERLLVVEPNSFSKTPSAQLAERYFPDVPLREPLIGHQGFFDISRTREVLGWVPSTERADVG